MPLPAELIRQLDDLVSAHDYVVGYSEQLMPERGTGRESVRIYVDTEAAEDELRSSRVLTPELTNAGVDVVAVGRPEFQSTEVTDVKVGVDPKTKIRPLIGGISTGQLNPRKTGTLGYFVKRGNAMCLVSSAHVLPSTGQSAIQPGPNDGGASTDAVGTIALAVDDGNAGVDAAAATISQGVQVTLSINDIGTIAGTAVVQVDDIVRKSGKNSGVTAGTVLDPSVSVQIDGVLYRHQILIDGGTTPFSVPGDSGSLVISGDKAVGLIMAGDTAAKKSWANTIANVLQALGASLP